MCPFWCGYGFQRVKTHRDTTAACRFGSERANMRMATQERQGKKAPLVPIRCQVFSHLPAFCCISLHNHQSLAESVFMRSLRLLQTIRYAGFKHALLLIISNSPDRTICILADEK